MQKLIKLEALIYTTSKLLPNYNQNQYSTIIQRLTDSINSNWLGDLSLRPESIKLDKSIRKCSIVLVPADYLNTIPKAGKFKICKSDCIKLKPLVIVKKTTKKPRRYLWTTT